jgi:hypothetical protein
MLQFLEGGGSKLDRESLQLPHSPHGGSSLPRCVRTKMTMRYAPKCLTGDA